MPKYPNNITPTINEVSQTIEVSDYLGAGASNPRVVQEFGQAVVDRIRDRTADNKDFFGKKFTKYDEDYVDSEDFEEYDKSKSDVNMTLTGDMLDSLDFEQRQTSITVSVGSDQAAKAYNHCVGDTLPQRAFFGVTESELQSIAAEFDVATPAPTPQDIINLGAVDFIQEQTPRSIFAELFKELDIDFEN